MCIAIASPIGSSLPSEQYLKNSWYSNDDGGGIAYNDDNGRVKIIKGLMTWESFYSTLQSLNEKYDLKNRGVLLHFRIATAGGVNKDACHPFPICSDYEIMKKSEQWSKYAVIHNGIISLCDKATSYVNHVSDTMAFISKYLSNIASNKNWFENDKNFELIYELAKSKIAILNGNGDIHMTYGFTKDEDGNYYSNESYLIDSRWYEEYNYNHALAPWDDDDDDEYWGNLQDNYNSSADKVENNFYKESHYTSLIKLKDNEAIRLANKMVRSQKETKKTSPESSIWFDPETKDCYKGVFKYMFNKKELSENVDYLGKGSIIELCDMGNIKVPYSDYSTRPKDFFIRKDTLTELFNVDYS